MAFICSSISSISPFVHHRCALFPSLRPIASTCPITPTRRNGNSTLHTHSRKRSSSRITPFSSIETEVSQQMKVAMKAKDALRLRALRSIRAAFLNALKTEGAGDTLPDKDAISALRKLAKMRQESIEMYVKGGRDDLADEERTELEVIEQWLPKLASEEQMATWAQQAIDKTGASSKSDMGKVMGLVMKDHREEVNGNVLKKVVSSLLS